MLKPYPLPPGAIAIPAGCVVGGVAIAIIALRAEDTIVLADAEGIRKRWPLGNAFIPWAQVEGIRRQSFWGVPGYKVRALTGTPSISWPISPFHPSRRPWVKGAMQLTPDQMAALVAERVGQGIELSE